MEREGWFACCLLLGFTSCTHYPTGAMAPITKPQKDFYEIRHLHESGKSRELIPKADLFLKKYPDEVLGCSVKYYMAFHYERVNRKDRARNYYMTVMDSCPDSGWAKLAKSALETLGNAPGEEAGWVPLEIQKQQSK